jgi:hypothetical protein
MKQNFTEPQNLQKHFKHSLCNPLGYTTFNIMTLSIITLSIMTLSIKGFLQHSAEQLSEAIFLVVCDPSMNEL